MKQSQHDLKETSRQWHHTKFHPVQLRNLRENKGEGHPNWYQNVEFISVYQQTKFKRKKTITARMQASDKVIFLWNHKSFFFPLNIDQLRYNEYEFYDINTWTSLNSIPNSIQIKLKFCEIIGTEVLAFWQICYLEWRSTSLRPVSKCRVL